CGKRRRTVSNGGAVKLAASAVLPPTVLPRPAFNRHSGQTPSGASGASGFRQLGHMRWVSIVSTCFLRNYRKRLQTKTEEVRKSEIRSSSSKSEGNRQIPYLLFAICYRKEEHEQEAPRPPCHPDTRHVARFTNLGQREGRPLP